MSSEDNQGKMVSSSESVDAKVGDDDGTVRQVSQEDDSKVDEAAAATTPVNPLSSNAPQMLPMLRDLLVNNEIQRERLIGLIQLYDPTAAEGRNAMVNAEGEQIARETDLSSEVHFLEQSVKKLEEELENQKKANAQLGEQISRLTKNSDP